MTNGYKRLLTKTCCGRVRTENIINAQGNEKNLAKQAKQQRQRHGEKERNNTKNPQKKIKKKTKMRTRVKIHHNHQTSHFC